MKCSNSWLYIHFITYEPELLNEHVGDHFQTSPTPVNLQLMKYSKCFEQDRLKYSTWCDETYIYEVYTHRIEYHIHQGVPNNL